jgi:hypothetical protein
VVRSQGGDHIPVAPTFLRLFVEEVFELSFRRVLLVVGRPEYFALAHYLIPLHSTSIPFLVGAMASKHLYAVSNVCLVSPARYRRAGPCRQTEQLLYDWWRDYVLGHTELETGGVFREFPFLAAILARGVV